MPQLAQNLAPVASGIWQLAQAIAAGAAPGTPGAAALDAAAALAMLRWMALPMPNTSATLFMATAACCALAASTSAARGESSSQKPVGSSKSGMQTIWWQVGHSRKYWLT